MQLANASILQYFGLAIPPKNGFRVCVAAENAENIELWKL
jgi:hypothetical protein